MPCHTQDNHYDKEHRLHAKDQECCFCGALMYPEESVSCTRGEHHYGICCNSGKVQLAALLPPPEPMASWMQQDEPHGRCLFQHIRKFNNSLQMVSTSAANASFQHGGPQPYKICGTLSHLVGPLRPEQGQRPQYAQLWIYDADEQKEAEMRAADKLPMQPIVIDVMRKLQAMLRRENPYVSQIMSAADLEERHHGPLPELRLIFKQHARQGIARHVYNLPAVPEVAGIIPNTNPKVFVPSMHVMHMADT